MSETPYETFEPIIGLEIHTQLNTRTKLFSATGYKFGNEPNTNIGVVDTGQPGALPVLNREAVKKAVLFGLAVGAKISLFSRFDRKSYFYPDCPRNFQITQFDEPIIVGGEIVADVEGKSKTFTIEKTHLEDDAGMLKHFSDFAGVDFNRAGVPLIEIVSTPCMRSPKEATAFATASFFPDLIVRVISIPIVPAIFKSRSLMSRSLSAAKLWQMLRGKAKRLLLRRRIWKMMPACSSTFLILLGSTSTAQAFR